VYARVRRSGRGGPAIGVFRVRVSFLYGAVTVLTIYIPFVEGHIITFNKTFTTNLSMIECLVQVLQNVL
jgi:hypothetical protein